MTKPFNDSIHRQDGKRAKHDTFYGVPVLLSSDELIDDSLRALKSRFSYLDDLGINYVIVYPIEGIRDITQLQRTMRVRVDVTAPCIPVFEYSVPDHGVIGTLNSFKNDQTGEHPRIISYSYEGHALFSAVQISYDRNINIILIDTMCKALANDRKAIFGQVNASINIPDNVVVTENIAAFQKRFGELVAPHDIAVMLPTIQLETGHLDTKGWSNFWALNPQGAVGIIQFFPNNGGGYPPLMTALLNNPAQLKRVQAASDKYSFSLDDARREFSKIDSNASGTLRLQYEDAHDKAADSGLLGDGSLIDRVRYATGGNLGSTAAIETRIFMPTIFSRGTKIGSEKISQTNAPFKENWKNFYKEVFSADAPDAQAFQISAAINGYLLPSRKNIKLLGDKTRLLYERIEFDRDAEQGPINRSSHWELALRFWRERYKVDFTPSLLTDDEVLKFMRVYFLFRALKARETIKPARPGPSSSSKFTVKTAFAGESDNTVVRPIRRIRMLELANDSDVDDPGIADFIADFIDKYKHEYNELTYARLGALNKQGELM